MAATEELVDILARAKADLEPRCVVLGDPDNLIEVTIAPPLVTIRARDLGPIPADDAGRAEFLGLLLRANATLMGLAFCVADDQVHLLWRRPIADVDEAQLHGAFEAIERALEALPVATPPPLSQAAQELLDLDSAWIEAKKAVAIVIAEQKRLTRQLECEHHNVSEWHNRNALALAAGDAELAGEALCRKLEHDALARSIEAALQTICLEVNRSKDALRSIDSRCSALRRKRAAAAAAHAVAEARSRLTELSERLESIEAASAQPAP